MFSECFSFKSFIILDQTHIRIRIKDKDLFIGPQEFVVGYSKAP